MPNLARLIFRFDIPSVILGVCVVFSVITAAPKLAPTETTIDCKSISPTETVDSEGLRTYICKKV